MPRVIRVDDVDDDVTSESNGNSSGDPGPNKMIENDATMWLDGGPAEAVASANSSVALGPAASGMSATEAADITALSNQYAAQGLNPRTTEAGETLGRDVGAGLTVSETPPGPTGSEGATGDWNNYESIPDDNLVVFNKRFQAQVDPVVHGIAQQIARRLNITLTCTSGYRNREYNTSVGGASSSYHMRGWAMDLLWPNASDVNQKEEMVRAAIEAGAGGIGIYNSFMHIDIAAKRSWGSSSTSNVWAYNLLRQSGHE